ncbi:MAG: hypothetical protein AABX54_00040 [Nanoarchaeota archaeon]
MKELTKKIIYAAELGGLIGLIGAFTNDVVLSLQGRIEQIGFNENFPIYPLLASVVVGAIYGASRTYGNRKI